jgi:membrane protease YdiL (CAAX protease family)
MAFAVCIVNVIFGLSHYSTKRKNTFYAFALGAAWSVVYILTGSLWLAMLAHIAIDVHSFTMAYRLLRMKKTS